jgi:hypothetical protein
VAHAVEAVKRFDAGVKVRGIERFEKKPIPGKGMLIAYKGTRIKVDWTDITLSTDPCCPQAAARYVLADIALGANPELYRRNTQVPAFSEAISLLESGAKTVNADHFERKDLPGKGLVVVYRGTLRTINGMDVELSGK